MGALGALKWNVAQEVIEGHTTWALPRWREWRRGQLRGGREGADRWGQGIGETSREHATIGSDTNRWGLQGTERRHARARGEP
jgi:hypothetical protein